MSISKITSEFSALSSSEQRAVSSSKSSFKYWAKKVLAHIAAHLGSDGIKKLIKRAWEIIQDWLN